MHLMHRCPMCPRRVFTLVKLIQHIGLVHAHQPDFRITCGVSDCQSSFNKFHSYRQHVYRKHKSRCVPFRPDQRAIEEVRIAEQHSPLHLDQSVENEPSVSEN